MKQKPLKVRDSTDGPYLWLHAVDAEVEAAPLN